MKLHRIALISILFCLPAMALAVGAIATDDEEGDAEPGYGIATGYDTEAEAKKAALANCRKAGNENCTVSVWFKGCGAYASSKQYSGVGWGSSLKIAEAKAIDKCGSSGCKIQISECD